MSKITKNAQNNMVEHLNRVLVVNDPMTFQKVLLGYARGRHELALVAEQAGVRRETIWRYETGAAKAPLEVLVKIIAAIGAKLVIIPDEAP
jgi:DNA-binding phage protein